MKTRMNRSPSSPGLLRPGPAAYQNASQLNAPNSAAAAALASTPGSEPSRRPR